MLVFPGQSFRGRLKPLAAMLMGLGALGAAQAQGGGASPREQELPTLKVQAAVERESGKDSLKSNTTSIGKGNQELRDIPQSITVITEKLLDDRALDTLKEALKHTA
ncbi:MAG: hypothetical protein RIS35_769, partial [Pseudomonadota bacterium]